MRNRRQRHHLFHHFLGSMKNERCKTGRTKTGCRRLVRVFSVRECCRRACLCACLLRLRALSFMLEQRHQPLATRRLIQ